MTFDTTNEKTTRLSAFVGRSFQDEDKSVWYELRDIFDSLKPMGFEYEDAKEGQIRPISEKVKELIIRHEIYIGVLTKRYPIWQMPPSLHKRWLYPLGSYAPQKWTTSEWVIEEIGFAIGKDRKVLLLIEKDVNFPTADLDGDTQWVPFSRKNLAASQSEINQMILNLISERVTSKVEPTAIATVTPISLEKATELQEASFTDQLAAIKKHVLSGNFSKADRIQNIILDAESDAKMHSFIEALLLGIRAQINDTNALVRLKRRCEDNASDFHAIEELADVFSSFGQFNQATELLISHLDTVPINQRSMLVIRASQELCRDGKATQAISLLLEGLQKESDKSKHASIYREIASAAEKANDPDLESAFLEKVLKISPSNNDARFRLALVYTNNNLNQLAAYHYELVVAHTDWPGASNNLGIVYGELGFKANEYKSFESVADRYALAKANLASLYEVAGFLSEAENIAKDVISISENESDAQLAINRARFVLSEIEAKAKTEKEAIDRISDDTKKEREFMCAYAESYCAPLLDNDRGIFNTSHGDLEIVREGVSLKGEGIVTKITQRGRLLSIASPLDTSVIPVEPEKITYLLSLSAQIHGQSGIFKLNITPRDKSQGLLGYATRTIKGLLYFEDDGNVIQFLERDEKRRTVVSAQRKH